MNQPFHRTPDREDDPDAHDLPPEVILPEPRAYRRNQLRARLIVSVVGLLALLAMLASEPGNRVLQACVAAVAVVTVIHLARWLREPRA